VPPKFDGGTKTDLVVNLQTSSKTLLLRNWYISLFSTQSDIQYNHYDSSINISKNKKPKKNPFPFFLCQHVSTTVENPVEELSAKILSAKNLKNVYKYSELLNSSHNTTPHITHHTPPTPPNKLTRNFELIN